jgi:hypothetical protein
MDRDGDDHAMTNARANNCRPICVILLLLALVACLPGTAHATWTLTQVKSTSACNSPCAVTVTSTGASHLLVAGVTGPTGVSISSVSAAACSGSWTHAAGSNISNTLAAIDQYYCTSSASGQTSISITLAGTCSATCLGAIWEASSSLGTIALDSGATPAATLFDSANCTTCSGVALTLSGNNNFVTALAACANACSGLTGTGFTNDLANPNGNGFAHGIKSGSLTGPASWSQSPTGTLDASAAAFQETAGGGAASGITKLRKLERLGVIDSE